MFRALLWKEWRELWKWPVVSVAYVLLVFLVHHSSGRPLSADIWAETFLLWALALGIVVPTYLYTREKEAATAHFLFSKPLDKFRLWWWRLFIGLTVVITSAVLVYGTVRVMALLYEKTATFETEQTELVWKYACFGVFVYGLSCFTSTLFKRRLVATIVGSLVLVFLFVLWVVVSMTIEPFREFNKVFSESAHLSGVRYLILAPLFLFASLAVFAQERLWRQTRRNIIMAYAVSAVVFLIPSVAGLVYLSSEMKVAHRDREEEKGESKNRWFVSQMSEDGSKIFAHLSGEDLLVVIDLPHRKARIIDTGIIDRILLRPQGELLFYTRMGDKIYSSATLILTDYLGIEKKELFQGRFITWQNAPSATWSINGTLIGVAKGGLKELKDKAFVAIYDQSGSIVGEYKFPMLEDASLWALGWDAQERFYFFKEIEKDGGELTTYWRISPDDITPEQVSFIPEDECTSIKMSPDGRWFVRTKSWKAVYEDKENNVLHLTNLTTGEDFLVSENVGSTRWSQDGNILIFSEHNSQTENKEDSAARLILLAPETRERTVIPVEKSRESTLFPYWCQSDDIWFVTDDGDFSVFSLETLELEEVERPGKKWLLLYWEKDEPLLWQVENELIATDHDGSNPKEIFRFEGKKFFFDGEEQS